MNRPARARWARAGALVGLTAVALLVSGCVYLRLLEVKRQLADFDRHFSLETTGDLRLGCLTPVLLKDDFRWFGVTPASVQTLGQAEQWQVRWVKEVAPGAREDFAHEVEIELGFADNKFTRLVVPERYFELVSKEFLVGLMRGLGAADIDRVRRDAAVKLAADGNRPETIVTEETLTTMMGQPTARETSDGHPSLRYRYVPTPAGAKHGVFDLTFVFDPGNGRLVFLQGRTPVGKMSFRFEAAPTDAK